MVLRPKAPPDVKKLKPRLLFDRAKNQAVAPDNAAAPKVQNGNESPDSTAVKPQNTPPQDNVNAQPSGDIQPDPTPPKTPPASKVNRAILDALQHLDIGIDADERAYGVPKDQSNPIAYSLRSKHIAMWLRQRASKRGDLLKRDEINEIVEHLEALAAVDGNQFVVYLRVAPSECGGIELDLGTSDRKRARLADGKVTVIDSGSKVLFTRSGMMQPMPMPAAHGDWEMLLPYLNMDDKYKCLLVGWITFCLTHFKGQLAYPHLTIYGEQGSGKSFLGDHILRPLIDANSCGLLMFPSDAKDMVISSQNQHVLFYDNIRILTKRWSDILCIAATSGSLAGRKLYTDAEESVMKLHAPIVLNGIHHFVTEPDLASRCLTIQLERITPAKRREESRLLEELANDTPAIFRGLLDLSARLLEAEPRVESANLSRLTGFGRWLAAMENVLELPACELQHQYRDNLNEAMLNSIHESPLASAVLEFAEARAGEPWKGTPSQLLHDLSNATPPDLPFSSNGLPANAIALTKQLKSIERLLDSQGVTLEFGRGKERSITLYTDGDLY